MFLIKTNLKPPSSFKIIFSFIYKKKKRYRIGPEYRADIVIRQDSRCNNKIHKGLEAK